MTKKISIILLFLALLLSGAVGIVLADEGETPSAQDEALLALINQARENPLDVAASLGMDPEKILVDLPELAEILQEGLSPLTVNENLAEAAFAHTWDMFAQGYYSNLSPDGIDYNDRILETGYPAVVSGESLGMILFANFISPEDAVRLIFEYMFLDELDPLRTEKRNILDPCLIEAGISVQTGTLELGGSRWNVYLATCDFGSPLSCSESGLLELINQARENPLEMAAAMGMDPEQILADYPDYNDLLTQGLPPLMFNLNLVEAARAHAADMLAGEYYSHDSIDGRTFEERILEAGYDMLAGRESLGFTRLRDGIDAQEAVRATFAYILAQELAGGVAPEAWALLNPEFTEVGIGLATGQMPVLGGICGDEFVLVVADFGVPPPPPPPPQNEE